MSEPLSAEAVEIDESGSAGDAYSVAAPVEHVQENVEVQIGAGESLDVELDDEFEDDEPADDGE